MKHRRLAASSCLAFAFLCVGCAGLRPSERAAIVRGQAIAHEMRDRNERGDVTPEQVKQFFENNVNAWDALADLARPPFAGERGAQP